MQWFPDCFLIQSNPATLNIQGKQKLTRYNESSLYLNALLAKLKGNEKSFDIAGIRYTPCSIQPSSTVWHQLSQRFMQLTLSIYLPKLNQIWCEQNPLIKSACATFQVFWKITS